MVHIAQLKWSIKNLEDLKNQTGFDTSSEMADLVNWKPAVDKLDADKIKYVLTYRFKQFEM